MVLPAYFLLEKMSYSQAYCISLNFPTPYLLRPHIYSRPKSTRVIPVLILICPRTLRALHVLRILRALRTSTCSLQIVLLILEVF